MSKILSIARGGLNSAKRSLEVTSHNLNNANTVGYSRQRSHPTSLGTGGVENQQFSRIHEGSTQKRLNNSTSSYHFSKARSESLQKIDNLLSELDGQGLNTALNQFFNSFRQLSHSPENYSMRSIVLDNATQVINNFKQIEKELTEISSDINLKLENATQDINHILLKIAFLNKKISQHESNEQEISVLKDDRDRSIKSLSNYFKTHTYYNKKGHSVINAVGVGTLLSEIHPIQLISHRHTGKMEIYFKDRSQFPITDKFTDGKILSLINVRDKNIVNLKQAIDLMAYQFTTAVNSIHRQGFVSRSLPKKEDGTFHPTDHLGKISDINFFNPLTSTKNAASLITLNPMIQDHLSNIITGFSPNAPGDNRAALAIAKLQDQKIMNDDRSTLEEFYLKTLTRTAKESKNSQIDLEQSKGILLLANRLKDEVSGVSIDEETANLLKHQQTYEASAKIMQVASEMFDTILSIKR